MQSADQESAIQDNVVELLICREDSFVACLDCVQEDVY